MKNSIKVKYKKPFLEIFQQIDLLESRGLVVDNKERVSFILKYINYYHLSVYFKAFQKNESDDFLDNTKFEDVFGVYDFDRKLRLILLDVIERIELSLKSFLSYEITKSREKDIFWYFNKNNFDNFDNIEEYLKKVLDSKEIYLEHYYKKYSDKYPPVWMFFESLSFGNCSRLLNDLKIEDKLLLINNYKFRKIRAINFFYCLSHLRNCCAHYSRVWDRGFKIKVGSKIERPDLFKGVDNYSLFAYIIVIQIFIKKISPNSDWLDKLEDLINEYDIEISKMGFPVSWKERLESIN